MTKLVNLQLVNKTGGKTNPIELQKTIDGAEKYSPINKGDATTLNTIRADYAGAENMLGSVPPPASLKQGATTLSMMMQGKDMTVLVDKLSERICFEISGTRLYDAFLAKCREADSLPSGMTLEQVEHIREEEHQHFLMLKGIVESLGGDPTAVTPSADACATATGGLCKVVTDPRTTVLQALDTMLIAELTDNDGWSLLIDICAEMGLSEISEQFEKALRQEDEHLEYIRAWIGEGLLSNASLLSRARRSILNIGDGIVADSKKSKSKSEKKSPSKEAKAKAPKKKTDRKTATKKENSKASSKSKSTSAGKKDSSKKQSSKKQAGEKVKSKTRSRDNSRTAGSTSSNKRKSNKSKADSSAKKRSK